MLEFRKIGKTKKEVNYRLDSKSADFLEESESVKLVGEIFFDELTKLVKFEGALHATLNLICVRSGEEFVKNITNPLTLYISDGIYDSKDGNNEHILDIIEFFNGYVDLKEICLSEVESIRLDYHIKGE
ncbi:hypothetical protein BKH43_00500 [Helicobacter sp. 13S00401-1]|uniref:hypothetical protein n=1 Tax=Helicobacter sp. 13S00401-1 TaxID=1905758 RepID=UPI000BA6314B|nr:hypothetical protein [Helicobacter sp. 13S00401-1]PAF51750.1 hypothetical protein BKH43_00500 [Helicobacter sp. 13S00401-1]